jgi:membrane fusion protein, multidrug efflux system
MVLSRKALAAAAPLISVWLLAACGGKVEAPPPQPPDVTIAEVLVRDVPVTIENIGQTRGSTEVEVRARVQGFLQSMHFVEGFRVEKGQLLYVIDPREYEARLEQAKGVLAQAEAAYARATQDVERFRPLAEENAIPRQEYESSLTTQAAAKAQVDSARAQVETARINLEYTRVTAPISGLVGKTEVNVGNLVGAGQSTLLTSISVIDPIHVRFSISERDYLQFRNSNLETPTFELMLADGSVHPHEGRLVFADRLVDPQTGTLLLEAAFPNPERIVRSGQYARVRYAVMTREGAILVSQRSVQELQATYGVAVVKDGKVEMRTIEPGERIGSLRVVDSGLSAGEKVVVDGLMKVRDGIEVKATEVSIDAGAATPETVAGEN